MASAIVGGLPSGQPAETVFWLYHGQRVIGFSRLRHGLDDFHQRIGGHIGFGIRRDCRRQGYGRALLGLTLAEARRVGLATVLLTCTPGNLASRRIIEIHGGQLETGNDSDRICRYRINQ